MPREVTGLVAPALVVGGVDPHHVGTEIAEMHRGHGARATTRAVEHPNSRERRHRSISSLRPGPVQGAFSPTYPARDGEEGGSTRGRLVQGQWKSTPAAMRMRGRPPRASPPRNKRVATSGCWPRSDFDAARGSLLR